MQQVAVQYLRHGYWFYVAGQIPKGKDPIAVDAKLVRKYGIDVSRWERSRRKQVGLANMQYIRHERFFLLMATHGTHRFFEAEAGQIRDARRVPIRFAGYSISHRNGKSCVRIAPPEYARLKACFVTTASRRAASEIRAKLAQLPFVVYKPIRQQLLQIWRDVNRVRSSAGLNAIPIDAVRWRRVIVRPFG